MQARPGLAQCSHAVVCSGRVIWHSSSKEPWPFRGAVERKPRDRGRAAAQTLPDGLGRFPLRCFRHCALAGVLLRGDAAGGTRGCC